MGLIKITFELVVQRQFKLIVEELARRLWSKTSFFILHRDLTEEFNGGSPQIPLHMRLLRTDDIHRLLALNIRSMPAAAILERARRRHLLQAGIGVCYVAATGDDQACHMQWMITHDDNEKLLKCSGGATPKLMADEVLLENTFTLENYRKKGLWKWATSRLAEKAKKMGKRRLIVCINADKKISLNACLDAGFYPAMCREDRWVLFRRYYRFRKIHT